MGIKDSQFLNFDKEKIFMDKKVINMILLLVIVKDNLNKIEIRKLKLQINMINKDSDREIMIEIIAKRNNKNIVNIIKNRRKKDILHNSPILQDLDLETKERNIKNNKKRNILSIKGMIHQNLDINIKNDIYESYLNILFLISFKGRLFRYF